MLVTIDFYGKEHGRFPAVLSTPTKKILIAPNMIASLEEPELWTNLLASTLILKTGHTYYITKEAYVILIEEIKKYNGK